MQHPGFFERAGPFPLQVVAERVGAEITEASAASRLVEDVKALADAEAKDLAFFENRKYLDQLGETRAGACLVAPAFAGRCPADTVVLETEAPYRAFAHALTLFYPEAIRSKAADAAAAAKDGLVHPSAQIEEGVAIEPGAVIGREARIGRGTVIAAGALVGYRVAIGRDCFVGPMASVTHALVGDGVVVHAGVRIGQDGFGFAMGPDGHLKVPQIGRVIIQDRVEIGANSTVDRGALGDTVIGEGTKIDNLVQIAHNVVVGRHCVIVAQTGISGSTRLGDFVVMGGQSGTVGHIEIGAGAQIAAMSHPKEDVPAGARMGGTPARPARQWARELVALKRLASRSPGSADREKS